MNTPRGARPIQTSRREPNLPVFKPKGLKNKN